MPPTKESVWNYFIQKSVNNMHIVLAMSPVGDVLKTRCRNFPGLVNNVSIDWFTAWPKQALHAVASQFLAEVNLLNQSKFCGVIHKNFAQSFHRG